MGLYFRRSVRVGPLRFNFSTSGIGVSAGIPGLRVGTGPRGAYVHMGRGGVYYRQSLGASRTGRSGAGITDRSAPLIPAQPPPEIASESVGPMEEIESASVLALTDSSSQALLEEIRRRQALPRVAPWVVVGAGLLLFGLWRAGVSGLPLAVVLISCVAMYWWTSTRDALRRTMILGYELDADAAGHFEALMDAIEALNAVGGVWHVQAEATVRDRKYHAGASSVIKRDVTRPTVGQPPLVRTNLDVPSVGVGRQRLYFFPDRVLVYEGSNVGAVAYRELQVEVGTTRFVEADSVPQDAEVVDRTWRYVNRDGGPDRRFRDNRELPVALYETIQLRSATGLNELLHVSHRGVGAPIAHAVAQMDRLSGPGEFG